MSLHFRNSCIPRHLNSRRTTSRKMDKPNAEEKLKSTLPDKYTRAKVPHKLEGSDPVLDKMVAECNNSTAVKVDALRKLWIAAPVAPFYANYQTYGLSAPRFDEELEKKMADGFISYFCSRMIKADFSAFVEGDTSIFADYDRDFFYQSFTIHLF